MAQVIADRRDVDFVLHEQLEVGEFSKSKKFAEFTKKTVDLIINEARNLAVKEILPTQKIGDEKGCVFDGGKVTVPEEFHRVYKLFCEGEWLAMNEDPEWGGQGMPRTVTLAASDYFNGANYAFVMYPGLTHGAAKLVEAFGTDEQKRIFLKKMYSGEWTGTMLLTEPDAGSDVGALQTTAVKNEDGTYAITGNKIFISSGEHDLTDNIIHRFWPASRAHPRAPRESPSFWFPNTALTRTAAWASSTMWSAPASSTRWASMPTPPAP